MSGLQGYYNTVNNFGTSLDSAQNFLSTYDSSYLDDVLPNFQEKVKEAKEQASGLLEAGATIEGTYVAAKALKATYSAVKARLSKNDGDEEGDGEGDAEGGDEAGEEVATETAEVPEGEAAETGAETEAEPADVAEAGEDATGPETTTADAAADTTPVEAGEDLEDTITAQLQDTFAGPAAEATTASTDAATAGTSTSVSGTQYFSTEAGDEFDLPSGLGEAGDLSVGQDATTASRLADNTLLGSGERAGPEILGESTGGGTTGVTAEGASIDIPQIQSGGAGPEPTPAPSPADAEEGAETTTTPAEVAPSGESAEAEATADTAAETTEATSVAQGASEATASGIAETAAETGGEVAGEVAADAATSAALDTALGVASVAAEAVPVVGGLVALGIGLFELFHHHSKPKPPPPPQQTTTQKGEVVVPSFDSVTDTPASVSAF